MNRQELIDKYIKQGKSVAEIATIIGRSESYVRQYRDKSQPSPMQVQAAMRKKKISKDIKFIIKSRNNGLTFKSIAKKLGRNYSSGKCSLLYYNERAEFKPSKELISNVKKGIKIYGEDPKMISEKFKISSHIVGEIIRKYV